MKNHSAQEARQALAAVDGARSDAADRLVTPWWYHPVLGLLAAVFVVAFSIGGTWVMVGVAVAYFVGIGILVGAYKKKTGVWINGLRAGRASWWTLPLMVIMITGMGGAYYLHAELGLDWPGWLAGTVVFIAVNVFGGIFDRALRAELRNKQ